MEVITFLVDETPYACWDWHLHRKNLDFIEGIDAEYFRYVAESNIEHLKGDDKHRAALALRLAYSQGLEALLALLCALVQSPQCVVGWMIAYKNNELRTLVQKIGRQEKIHSRLKGSPVTWDLLSKYVHSHLGYEEQKLAWIERGFGQLWNRFANDYLSEGISHEYNGVKHGLRTKPGGFFLAIGKEDKLGVPAPPERMQTIGGSDFGTSFFTREPIIASNRMNFRPRKQSRNWNPENLANGLILLSMSINNVVSFLRIFNGVPPDKCKFTTPTEEEVFEEPWNRCVGIDCANFDTIVESGHITPFTKDEIIRSYEIENNL